ncbi:MAG: hypothetical protein P1P84_02490, partial [Deferrisomatales bacterium]|nr:hypothetical protein [Deferrisomatales bacterium]
PRRLSWCRGWEAVPSPFTVQVAWHEKPLREKLKKHGGQWDPARKLWSLRYNAVVYLGLEDRIVVEKGRGGSGPGDVTPVEGL